MNEYTEDKPLRVFEAFAGYGSQAMALERLSKNYPDFHFKVVGISEIDKYAIQAYEAVHGSVTNYGDITKVEISKLPDFDLFTYSFPCQSISIAGSQAGLSEGSGTRSSLLWECRKIIREKRPKFLLMENVKALVQKKFINEYAKWLAELEEMGYSNYSQVLNAKDYGVPQNRERVFCVSILNNEGEQPKFTFPLPQKLDKRLKDILEDNVPESYYLSEERMKGIEWSSEMQHIKGNGFTFKTSDGAGVATSVTTKAGSRKTDNFIEEDE